MQENKKKFLSNEIITYVFAVLLAITASYLSVNSQIEEELVNSIWITNGLVMMSLIFRCFFQLLFQEKLIKHIPYFRIIAPILFWLSIIYIPLYITLTCTVIGIIGFVFNPSNSKRRIFSIYYLIIPFLYFIIIGSEAWNMHRTPLPGHYLIIQSQTGSDLTCFSAITSMLKTYNICSIGIDGPIGFQYHFGTYYFFASLSSLLNLNSIYINHIIAPLVFLPLALFIMLEILANFKNILGTYFNIDTTELKIRDHAIFAAILTTLTNAPFGLPFVANLSFFTSPFQIDSQLLANLLLGIIIVIMSKISITKNKHITFSIFFLIFIQSIICITKSPASHLSLILLFYTCFRYSLQRTAVQNKLWFSTIILCSIATYYISDIVEYQSLVKQKEVLTIGLFSLWQSQIPFREWQWIYLSNGFYTIASIFLSTLMFKKISALEVFSKFKNSRFSLIEIFSFLSFTAISLSAVFEGALSFASTYYMDTAKFLSLILLVACISILFSRIEFTSYNFIKFLKSNSSIRVISVFSIGFILISGTSISLKGWERTFNKHNDTKLANSRDQKTQNKVDILKTLLHLSKTYENKSETCLWIPKTNNYFWNELALQKNEVFLPFWAVSLSEMTLIDGYPLSNDLNGMFGYGSYVSKSSHDPESTKNLFEIKRDARKKGFKYLIVLRDHETHDIFTL